MAETYLVVANGVVTQTIVWDPEVGLPEGVIPAGSSGAAVGWGYDVNSGRLTPPAE
ncbi:hypothetical protein ACFQ4O_01725 [Methylopila musalis]|uniref:Uncharacterized protein n=1 Tax=Methylopila musalis TaxID=1134781 RepID=A0ABW3Z3G2_9HYPH